MSHDGIQSNHRSVCTLCTARFSVFAKSTCSAASPPITWLCSCSTSSHCCLNCLTSMWNRRLAGRQPRRLRVAGAARSWMTQCGCKPCLARHDYDQWPVCQNSLVIALRPRTPNAWPELPCNGCRSLHLRPPVIGSRHADAARHMLLCPAQVPLAFFVLENAAGEGPRILGVALLQLSISIARGGLSKEPQHTLPLLSPSGAHAAGNSMCSQH